jgi:hypothetical protein
MICKRQDGCRNKMLAVAHHAHALLFADELELA